MRFLAALFGLLLITGSAQAASSINTAQPLQGIPYNASPVRLNFGAAANDINALQTLNAGASAPSNPSLGYLWVQTGSASKLYPLSVWDGVKWLPIGTVDAATHLWTPPVGGGAAGSLLSAATTDLGSVAASSVTVTGNNPIFSFGASAPPGTIKFVTFSGSPTLNYNATSLLLPTKANISVSAGDTLIAQALGAGSWNVLVYQTVSGFPINIFTTGQVQNTTALRNACTGAIGCPLGDFVFPNGVIRWTDGVAGAPPLPFSKDTAGICSADDGGHCVAAAGGGYWLAQFSGPADVREWGAVADGVTDAGPAINLCLAAESACLIPPSQNGFYVATTIVNPSNALIGSYINTTDQSSFVYPGSSFIFCSTAVTPCVQQGNGSVANAPSISNVIVSRAGGTPTAGTIGVEWDNVYGPNVSNVMIRNSDTCAKFLYSGNVSIPGSAGFINNLRVNSCGTHYIDIDAWPELQFIGGRVGKNGAGDYAAQDYVYFEDNAVVNSGPNTVSFVGTQFNTGTAADVPACFFRWGNFNSGSIGAGAVWEDYKFIGVHAEGGTGGPRTGVICSDATVPYIGTLNISNSEMNTNDGTTPFFALNPLTALNFWHLNNNTFGGCHDFTLAPAPAGGVPGFKDVTITNNDGCNNTSYTSPGTGLNYLQSTGNNWGSTTIAGLWDRGLVMNELSYGNSITDTATGTVRMNEPWQNFTPTLEMGGVAGGWTLAGGAVAQYKRTYDGGFDTRFSFQVGTTDSGTTGAATLAGLPLTCSTGVNSTFGLNSWALTSVTIQPMAYISNKNYINFSIASAAGNNSLLSNTNFNSTSDTVTGTAHCTQAQ